MRVAVCRPRSRVSTSTVPSASILVLQRGIRYAANRSDVALAGNGACLPETSAISPTVAATYLITLIPARLFLLFASDKVVRGISNPEPVAKKQFKEQSPQMRLTSLNLTGAGGTLAADDIRGPQDGWMGFFCFASSMQH